MQKKPKVLLYDIETTPNLAFVWGKYQQDVIEYEREWELLSVAWKWLGEKEVHALGRNGHSEPELVKLIWTLFDKADVVIAHNGDRFDNMMMTAKFLEYEMDPPSWYQTVDTRKVAKKHFRLNSNKLDDIGKLLGLGEKIHVNFDVWRGCMDMEPDAWKKMLSYNKQDVKLLEQIYIRMLPWISNHPSMSLIGERPSACPKCGEGPMEARGYRITKVAKYQRYQCQHCGGWSQGRQTIKTETQYTN